MTPSVDIIKSQIRFLDGRAMPWANKVNHLCYNREYIDSVSVIASAYAARGHKVLVVSNRVHFLKTCLLINILFYKCANRTCVFTFSNESYREPSQCHITPKFAFHFGFVCAPVRTVPPVRTVERIFESNYLYRCFHSKAYVF